MFSVYPLVALAGLGYALYGFRDPPKRKRLAVSHYAAIEGRVSDDRPRQLQSSYG